MSDPPRHNRRRSPTGLAVGKAALWVVLAVALIWLRARSRTHDDVAALFTPSGNLQALGSSQGRVYFFVSGWNLGPERGLTADFATREEEPPDPPARWHDADYFHELLTGYADDHAGRWGFDWYTASRGPQSNAGVFFAAVAVPTWALAAACALPPVVGLGLAVRRRRARGPTACEHCGYDLRATPEPNGPLLGRCPECGQPASANVRKEIIRGPAATGVD